MNDVSAKRCCAARYLLEDVAYGYRVFILAGMDG
jgi:hypothetical protein